MEGPLLRDEVMIEKKGEDFILIKYLFWFWGLGSVKRVVKKLYIFFIIWLDKPY